VAVNKSLNHRYFFGWRRKSRRSEFEPLDVCQWHDV